MILSPILERFVEKTPLTVMARAAMEHALAPSQLDAMFAQHADRQYTRELLFSSVVDVMGAVVGKVQPSVHAAFQSIKGTLPVSATPLYNKLNGTEPALSARLVTHVADRLAPVIESTGGEWPALVAGYRVRILDGNHFAATERRLKVLRGSVAGPLPGHALVVLDPSLMLATHMIPCEDAHAQERSLSGEILKLVNPKDVWIADRNFCTIPLLTGIAAADGFFVIRQHASLPVASQGTLRRCGQTGTGEVFEQSIMLRRLDGKTIKARRIVIQLDSPTENGDREIAILTNLPKSVATAIAVANLYRKRWTLEIMFHSLTKMLEGEINTLGHPPAALLGFAIALTAYNALSTVQAALRANFGAEKVQEEVSGYYIANEVRGMTSGMLVIVEPAEWDVFQTMKPAALGRFLLKCSTYVRLEKYKRRPRGPKRPVPKRTRFRKKTHVSTARLLAEQ